MNTPSAWRPGWRAQLELALQTLQTWPWLETLKTLRIRFREDRLGLTAGSLTFTTLISLVPLVTVMLALFTAFPMFASFQDALQNYFVQSLVPDSIAKPVLTGLTQFAGKASRLGAVGLVALGFTALTLMLTIDRTLNGIWRVRKPRPIAQRVLVYWSAVTLGPLLLGLSLSLTSYAISSSRGVAAALPGGVQWLLSAIEFGSLLLGIAGLFRFVPNTHVQWRHALSGAAFVAVGIEVAKKLLGWYLGTVPGYALVYGAFATVPILLVWIYLGWVIVLLGAVIAAYAPSLQMHVARWPDVSGARFALAVTLLREMSRAQRGVGRALGVGELSRSLRVDPLQIEPVLAILLSMDWVGRLDEQGDLRFVLICDLTSTRAKPLLTRLLLDDSLPVGAFWTRAGLLDLTLAELIG